LTFRCPSNCHKQVPAPMWVGQSRRRCGWVSPGDDVGGSVPATMWVGQSRRRCGHSESVSPGADVAQRRRAGGGLSDILDVHREHQAALADRVLAPAAMQPWGWGHLLAGGGPVVNAVYTPSLAPESVCARARVCVCVCACMCASVYEKHACVRVRARVRVCGTFSGVCVSVRVSNMRACACACLPL
jgi:hypothetical protein